MQLALEAGLAQDDDARLRSVRAEALATTHPLHQTVEEVLRLSRVPDRARIAARGVPVTSWAVPVTKLVRETTVTGACSHTSRQSETRIGTSAHSRTVCAA